MSVHFSNFFGRNFEFHVELVLNLPVVLSSPHTTNRYKKFKHLPRIFISKFCYPLRLRVVLKKKKKIWLQTNLHTICSDNSKKKLKKVLISFSFFKFFVDKFEAKKQVFVQSPWMKLASQFLEVTENQWLTSLMKNSSARPARTRHQNTKKASPEKRFFRMVLNESFLNYSN